jgi:hypothetical protein
MNEYLQYLNVKEENFWSARILRFAEYSSSNVFLNDVDSVYRHDMLS